MTKILFMGSDAIALPVLESLRESSQVEIAGSPFRSGQKASHESCQGLGG